MNSINQFVFMDISDIGESIMEIQSATASGLQSLQKAQSDATQASADIAANLAVSPEDFGIGQENNTDTADKNSDSAKPPNLTEAAVNLKVAEFQAKASVNVIQTADETLGTLLDIRA
jgi:hypothetical protein